MPNFMLSLCLRYALVSAGITVALFVIVMLLISLGYIDDAGSSTSMAITAGSGLWAGNFFAKHAGRAATWPEAWKMSAVLSLILIAEGAMFTALPMAFGGSSPAGILGTANYGVLLFAFIFGYAISLIATACFLRMGSKQMITYLEKKAAKDSLKG